MWCCFGRKSHRRGYERLEDSSFSGTVPGTRAQPVVAPSIFTEDPAPPREIYSLGSSTQLLLGKGTDSEGNRKSFLRLKSNDSIEIKNFIHGREVMWEFGIHEAILQVYDSRDRQALGLHDLICEPIQGILALLLQELRNSYKSDYTFYKSFFTKASKNYFVNWARSLARGLLYIHNNGWIHGTLSSKTIWVAKTANQEGSILRIGGFDHALKANFLIYKGDPRSFLRFAGATPELDVNCMTVPLAPETINHGSYSQATDVFSLGIVLWEILTLENAGVRVKVTAERINKTYRECVMNNQLELLLPFPANTPLWIKNLISRCWQPVARPSAQEVYNTILKQLKKDTISGSTEV